MNEQIAKLKKPIMFLIVGMFLGGISTYKMTYKLLEMEKKQFYNEVRSDMAGVRDKILKEDNPSLRDIDPPVFGIHEVNDKYLKSFAITEGDPGNYHQECILYLKNELEYGDVSPSYDMVFYDEYGVAVFEVSDRWMIQDLCSGCSETKSEEFYIPDIDSLRYYTATVF